MRQSCRDVVSSVSGPNTGRQTGPRLRGYRCNPVAIRQPDVRARPCKGSVSQRQDIADLLPTADRPGICMDEHLLLHGGLSYQNKLALRHTDLLEARWKAKLCCEFSESRGSAHPRLSERYRQFLLGFFCHRLIVVKNARHHDGRTKIVSHPACTSEHMPDGMAGSHRHPSL